MSFIQTVRDKYAGLIVVLIALALVGFILMDYFSSRSRSGGDLETTIGSINGKKISFDEFNQLVLLEEVNIRANNSGSADNAKEIAINSVWERTIEETLLSKEAERLGLEIGKKELGDILYGEDAPPQLQEQFRDSKTGRYNGALAKDAIEKILKSGNEEQKQSIRGFINSLVSFKLREKYSALLLNSINFPSWYIQKQNEESSQIARISFVKELYSSIPNESVKITDQEVEGYIKKHENLYKNPQEGRSISFVKLAITPSTKDSTAASEGLAKLKEPFLTTADPENFLASEGAEYFNGYRSEAALKKLYRMPDDIFSLSDTTVVVGPILDPGSDMDPGRYSLVRYSGKGTMYDSATFKHIFISTNSRDSATAYKLCDSIQNVLAGGAIFDSLVVKLSEDPDSKTKGGLYKGYMAKNYLSSMALQAPSSPTRFMDALMRYQGNISDFVFTDQPVKKGILKTRAGFHYIEVVSQSNKVPAYKLEVLSREIPFSQETESVELAKANEFAGRCKDLTSFNSEYEKNLKPKGYTKESAVDILPLSYSVSGVGPDREFVRTVFNSKKGQLLEGGVQRVGNNFFVSILQDVTQLYDLPTQGGVVKQTARKIAEPVLMTQKKAAILKNKLGKISTLEAASTALGQKPIEVADSITISGRPMGSLAYEPAVFGAAFNPSNKGKVVATAIEGREGVYVLRVDNVGSVPVLQGDINSQRQSKYQEEKIGILNRFKPDPVSVLKAAATIKDNRHARY